MSVHDKHVAKAAKTALKHLNAAVVTAISLTDAVIYSFTPGYRFQIERIRSFCRTKAGTVTAVVKVGTRTAASITFTAATEVAQALSSTLADLQGSASEAITIELTTDGSGALTNGAIVISIRPRDMHGDPSPVLS